MVIVGVIIGIVCGFIIGMLYTILSLAVVGAKRKQVSVKDLYPDKEKGDQSDKNTDCEK